MSDIFTIKLSSTWDHYPVCAVLQEGEEGEEGRGYVKKRKACVGRQPRDEDASKN